jgi:glyoxylase-like metal-dependent hydrolase (beta-lactamase superfamily II)
VPPTGQSFTTLSALKSSTTPKYTNKHKPLDKDSRFISIWTEPKFGIGQRAILIKTLAGNVLWDCITLLDDETVEWISSQGGLKAIVISHPHYYTTHLEWAKTFSCPVYISKEDEEWLCRSHVSTTGGQVFVETEDVDIFETGVKAVKLGGHFPGSLVCLYDGRLLIADTLLMTPAGMGNWKDKPRPKGMNSFAFMWSIPNVRHIPYIRYRPSY